MSSVYWFGHCIAFSICSLIFLASIGEVLLALQKCFLYRKNDFASKAGDFLIVKFSKYLFSIDSEPDCLITWGFVWFIGFMAVFILSFLWFVFVPIFIYLLILFYIRKKIDGRETK
jgi:hypothetical protein